jgi:acyl-CoA thioester hydrolase
MGYVYYGNYAAYYEVARVESFRHLGYAYKQLEEEGVMMPVLELNSKYLIPAKYDDLLTIKVSIPELPKVKIKYLYEIRNEEGALLNEGETTLVFINMKTGKPVRMPEVMGALLKPFF